MSWQKACRLIGIDIAVPDIALDLRYLQYALVAAELGSFRRAAAAFDVRKSTSSRRVQLLEHRFGFVLFERDRGGVRLSRRKLSISTL
jgi:hypothetical protein